MATNELTVGDVMTRGVVTLGPNDKLTTADDVMRLGRIRHMPVVDDGELVGIVSQRDLFRGTLLRALGYGRGVEDRVLDAMFVKDAMTTEVATVGPDTPLAEAAGLMLERKIGCLVVADEGELLGILTEADFVAMAAKAD